MKININAHGWNYYHNCTYLDEIETRIQCSCSGGGDIAIKMITIEDLTPRQVSGYHYNFWSLHKRELQKEKKS